MLICIFPNTFITFDIGSFSGRLRSCLFLKKWNTYLPYGIVLLACLGNFWNFLINHHGNPAYFVFILFHFLWVIDNFFLYHHISFFQLFTIILFAFLINLRMVSLFHPPMAFITIHPSFTSRILYRFQLVLEIPKRTFLGFIIIFEWVSSKILDIMGINTPWSIMS